MSQRRFEGTRLRAWQREALAKYQTEPRRDFLVTATPGSGKTTFALSLAVDLLNRRIVDRLIVVAPTDHLRTQWAEAAEAFGISIDPTLSNAVGPVPSDRHGYVTTYAQVAGKPSLHAARATSKRSLVIFDEIHHAGDGLSWGDAVGLAFDNASRRLCLTGTPFRTKTSERIPFVRYERDETGSAEAGALVSTADYSYGYRQALADRVVRPVVFAAYTGTSRWRNSAGEVIAASLTEAGTVSTEQAAWRTALDPRGDWVPHVIAAMDERLVHLRSSGMPDAAGLVLASDQDDARAYADIVERVTGERPYLILSDDPKASQKIGQFALGGPRIAVCVRMVSEGVDVPRAACLAWLTSYRTPLFFAQAVGRVVRARSRHESATVFLPAVRPLLALAAELEQDRNHVLPPPASSEDSLDLVDDVTDEAVEHAEDSLLDRWEALEAEAQFAHVLHSGRAVTADAGRGLSDDDEDFLGLPGLLSPEQTAALLMQRDSALRKRVSRARSAALNDGSAEYRPDPARDQLAADIAAQQGIADGTTSWRAARELRREVNRLVSVLAARKGAPHAAIHSQLRTAVPGPASASASVELLEARRTYLMGML